MPLQVLSENTDLLTVAFDAMAEGVIVCDYKQPDMPVIYCNKPFETFTGYTLAEIKGKNPRFMQGDTEATESRNKIRTCLQAGESCRLEIINHKKDGSLYWVDLKLYPVKDNKGQIAYYVSIQDDITERKFKEVNKRFNAEQAANLQEIKEDFINIASHELKTPLTSLAASIQTLDRIQDQASQEQAKKLLKQSKRSINKIKAVVDDLVLFTNIKDDILSLNKISFALSEIIDTCCSAVKSAGRHRLVMKGNHGSVVLADKQYIEQMLTNLVNNAAKYGKDSDAIELEVVEEGEMAKVSVTDNGQGIDEKQLPYIFDRHYRSSVTGISNSGLGVGLYICSEIVKRHEGKIGVQSKKGIGSTFWFTLPLCPEYSKALRS